MNPILRVLLGILGIFITIIALVALLFSGTCVSDGLGMFGAPSGLAWFPLLLGSAGAAVSGLALWLGLRVCRWGLRGPSIHQRADDR